MNNQSQKNKLEYLCSLVKEISENLSFSIIEIGALPIGGQSERFHQLLNFFPESQIVAFEVDRELCEKLNQETHPNIKYFPVALGLKNGECPFYITKHPMCCSLYEPNKELMETYNNLEVALLESVSSINTITLDDFAAQNHLNEIDFIKIDIQGAELDVFMGGKKILKDVVCIVSEVEFIPLYIDQPLFGDICKYLTRHDFMFHKFLGLAGRTISPVVLNDDLNFASQHMWSDAIFIKDVTKLSILGPEKLLKMGILAFLYGSIDVAFHCFDHYDNLKETSISQAFLKSYL